MRLSIKSVFKNITIWLGLLTVLLAVISWTEFQRYKAHDRFDDLLKIQKTVFKVSSLNKINPSYSEILLKSYIDTISNQIQELHEASSGGLFSALLDQGRIQRAIKKLSTYIDLYNQDMKSYLLATKKQQQYTLEKVKSAQTEIMMQINVIEERMIQADFVFTDKFQWIIYLTFLISLFAFLFYRQRLRAIHLSIEALYGINAGNPSKIKTLTQETEAIKQKMARKPVVTENPSMVDPVTQIKNYKGMIHSYANKKGTKEKSFTAVCLFEIDNFAQNNDFSQEFVNNVLKKIASILSLYEQATDVVARFDFNQFVFIVSRDTKAKMFQECESIRQSIEELKFKTRKDKMASFTVSGGFVIKPRHKSLDDILKDASKLLLTAQNKGGNQIIQIKDYAENF